LHDVLDSGGTERTATRRERRETGCIGREKLLKSLLVAACIFAIKCCSSVNCTSPKVWITVRQSN